MSRTASVAVEPTVTTPESKREHVPLCPLKRQLSADYQADDEQPETSSPLEPRKLDLEQHVSFGYEEEDKYAEKSDDPAEEEEIVPTQKYEPPEEVEEGEIQSSAERLLSCPQVSG
jgi:hypothetical protein